MTSHAHTGIDQPQKLLFMRRCKRTPPTSFIKQEHSKRNTSCTDPQISLKLGLKKSEPQYGCYTRVALVNNGRLHERDKNKMNIRCNLIEGHRRVVGIWATPIGHPYDPSVGFHSAHRILTILLQGKATVPSAEEMIRMAVGILHRCCYQLPEFPEVDPKSWLRLFAMVVDDQGDNRRWRGLALSGLKCGDSQR